MSKKILVAEDSSVIQNLTKRILKAQKYEVTTVKNGKRVIEILGKEQFDIILMDINMPLMDGMECAQEIRKKNLPNSKIPIIAITGNAKNYTIEDFQEIGINNYLPKPLNYDHMVEMISKYVS